MRKPPRIHPSKKASVCEYGSSIRAPGHPVPVIAQDSGNRWTETSVASNLWPLEAKYGDPLVALDHLSLAIRNMHDSGNTTTARSPLAILAVFLDRLGHYEPSATLSGFAALNPMTTASLPELGTAITHLRNVLGDQTYESLARKGETMTTAEMVTDAACWDHL
jgi:hypothetical protein